MAVKDPKAWVANVQRLYRAYDAEGVSVNVRRALDAGVAGLSIEDMSHEAGHPLYETAVAYVSGGRTGFDSPA